MFFCEVQVVVLFLVNIGVLFFIREECIIFVGLEQLGKFRDLRLIIQCVDIDVFYIYLVCYF